MGASPPCECHRVTGDDCFILKLHLDAIESLDRALDRFLMHATTTTAIVQSSPVPPRALPLPGRTQCRHQFVR
jgi:Lrp/AsnC family transcriptional regulator, leucine-responsive regulatory protein